MQDQIRRLGSQNIIIQSVKPPPKEDNAASRNFVVDYGLTYADAERAGRNPPPRSRSRSPIKARPEDMWVSNRKVTVQMLGTVPWFTKNHPVKILRGRFITQTDMTQLSNVCVLGAQRRPRALPFLRTPLGKPVKLGRGVYVVVGIVADAQAPAAKIGRRHQPGQPERRLLCPADNRALV